MPLFLPHITLFALCFFHFRYCWKLVYIYMLGYTVDFGHMEMINLLSSHSFKDKAVGFAFLSFFLHPNASLPPLSYHHSLTFSSFFLFPPFS